ncbi:hypothetical protein [Brachybacterium phenoliresistens]|uniref:hypothetical protein n=1 Tax=Brachybacterium phenoliresistens TaxID=396014 RepID=UPI0004B640D0|nr:hypothetical protein [Brachybacterium phenoliresistens]
MEFFLDRADAHDLYGFSPRLVVDDGGSISRVPLPPILVGYMDMSMDVARRILDRR